MINKINIPKHELSEENLIQIIRKDYKKSPSQINDVFTSDAEIIDIGTDNYLVCTTDTISEEIRLGIIEEPWKIGWLAVNINLSDLAAVGAKSTGVLLSWNIPNSLEENYILDVSRGISDAVNFHKTYILGGDINTADQFQITGTAFGFVRNNRYMQRIGAKIGDSIFMTGAVGIGNALGFAKLKRIQESKEIENLYRPTARCFEAEIISKYATACIDTSDGVISSLDILSRLNQFAIIYHDYSFIYHDIVQKLSSEYKLPLWLFAAAEHGEFELIFTVPPQLREQCIEECSNSGIQLFEVGKTMSGQGIFLEDENHILTKIDIGHIKELSKLIRYDPKRYLEAMLEYSLSICGK